MSFLKKINANWPEQPVPTKNPEEKLKKLAGDVLANQNESNMMGLSNHFAKAVTDLYHALSDSKSPRYHETGENKMKEVSTHPIITLWLDKMCSLNKKQDANKALEEVKKLAQ